MHDMYLIEQGRRVYKAREKDYAEREAKEALPINICLKTPASSLPSKILSHEKGEGRCGNEHIRVFRHFPNGPCVPACMMSAGLRLDPSTPMPCEHVWLMREGFHIMLHTLPSRRCWKNAGSSFSQKNLSVISDARQGNNGYDYPCRKNRFVSFAISPCFLIRVCLQGSANLATNQTPK